MRIIFAILLSALYFNSLDVRDGLSQMSVLSITQDSEGYMWFGTRDGLNRYDGYEFQTFRKESDDSTSLSNNHIHALACDKDGRLLVGTDDGLNIYDSGRQTFKRLYPKPEVHTGNANVICCICPEENGDIWIGTYSGLFLLKDGKLIKSAITDDRVWDIVSREGERFFCTMRGGLLRQKKDGRISRYFDDSEIMRAVLLEGTSKIMVAKTKGSYLSILDLVTSEIADIAAPGNGLQNPTLIRDMLAQKDDSVIVGAYDGLWKVDVENLLCMPYPISAGGELSHCSVESLFEDRAGSLWVGTYGGGINFAHKDYSFFHHRKIDPALTPGIISSLVCDPDGRTIWIGTDSGGLIRYDSQNDVFRKIPFPCGKFSNEGNIKTMLLDGDNIVIGLYSGQVFSIDRKTENYRILSSDRDTRPVVSLDYFQGELLAGCHDAHGIKRITGTKPELVPHDLEDNSGRIINIVNVSKVYGNGEELWIGTRNAGVYRFKPKEILSNFSVDTPFRTVGNAVNTIFADRNGRVFIGFSDGGLNVFQDGTLSRITPSEGLGDPCVCSMDEDEHGLWVVTRTGISLLDADDLSIKRSWNRSCGIGIKEFSPNATIRTADGRRWIAGDDCLVFFHPDSIKTNTYIPPVVITSPSKEKVNLKWKDTSITLAFSALNFIYPSNNRYEYRLLDSSQNWTEVDASKRTVSYPKLNPGRYRFEVRGSNNDGIWNEEPAYCEIFVPAPPYFCWWSICLYVICLVIIVYFTAKRIHKIHQRRKTRAKVLELSRKSDEDPRKYAPQSKVNTLVHGEKVSIILAMENPRLRGFLNSELSAHWRVITAGNYQEALSLTGNLVPSLVISDVYIPGGGILLCRSLKESPKTKHIPVILLTARQFKNQISDGLKAGAVDCLEKPFHSDLLIMKADNILASRESLKMLYGESIAKENLGTQIDAANTEERLLQRINSDIGKLIKNPELNIEMLSEINGMSRSTLYRKIVAATGMSPVKYIMTIRLNQAAKLLTTTNMSVTEIAEETGFGSIVHFSNAFKKKYGMAPSLYGRKFRQQADS